MLFRDRFRITNGVRFSAVFFFADTVRVQLKQPTRYYTDKCIYSSRRFLKKKIIIVDKHRLYYIVERREIKRFVIRIAVYVLYAFHSLVQRVNNLIYTRINLNAR